MVFHSTLYDGAWERAALEAMTPIFSVTTDLGCSKLGTKTVKNVLLEDWKQCQGRSAELGVKFVTTPPSLPETAVVPEMLVCKVMDENTLAIPSDTRQRWLRDPLRSKEWKEILVQFDKIHTATAVKVPAINQETTGSDSAAAVPQAAADFWAGVFSGSTKSLEELERNCTVSATFPLHNTTLVCKVTEGPEFYLCATTAAGSVDTSSPLLTHGGGQWLIDSKAAKALEAQAQMI